MAHHAPLCLSRRLRFFPRIHGALREAPAQIARYGQHAVFECGLQKCSVSVPRQFSHRGDLLPDLVCDFAGSVSVPPRTPSFKSAGFAGMSPAFSFFLYSGSRDVPKK